MTLPIPGERKVESIPIYLRVRDKKEKIVLENEYNCPKGWVIDNYEFVIHQRWGDSEGPTVIRKEGGTDTTSEEKIYEKLYETNNHHIRFDAQITKNIEDAAAAVNAATGDADRKKAEENKKQQEEKKRLFLELKAEYTRQFEAILALSFAYKSNLGGLFIKASTRAVWSDILGIPIYKTGGLIDAHLNITLLFIGNDSYLEAFVELHKMKLTNIAQAVPVSHAVPESPSESAPQEASHQPPNYSQDVEASIYKKYQQLGSMILESLEKSTKSDAVASPCEAMYRSSDDVRESFITGIETFAIKPIQYSAIDGMAIFEGDIAIGTVDHMEEIRGAMLRNRALMDRRSITMWSREARAEGVVLTGERFRWPDGLIPFTVQSDNLLIVVRKAIQHWEKHTPIRFIERTDTNKGEYPNWVSFEVQEGCWSYVGMQGGMQVISLGNGCGLRQAIHEIGHAVGLWHEQGREDRDRYIRINWENIEQDRRHNFEQRITDGDDIGTYDFSSIMHYPAMAFSRNGRPTIQALGGQSIGNQTDLSAGDIAAVQAMYPSLA